ncbi:unnamed protein product [Adineta steineri]|uniref:Tetraspanin n=1 Tax=Adineta steineri TaxID=433720 RepID=A0A814ZVE4_9BILA|nr:unnamed protein product [Adineta steineri]CAF3657254.1 unnamed protein product [Adineta steineri]
MARLSCGIEITCIVLFALNITFLAFGFCLVGFGTYIKVSKKFDIALSEHISTAIIGGEAIETAGVILIIVGIFTVLLSAFGCLGALLKNRIFLCVYGMILNALILLELAAFIIMMSSRVRIRDSYHSGLWGVFTNAYGNNRPDLIAAVEELEREFKCCGVYGFSDYLQVLQKIPSSCYLDQSFTQPIFGKGCADAFIDWMWDEVPILSGIVAAILIIEIFGVITSFAMAAAVSHYTYGRLDGKKFHETAV